MSEAPEAKRTDTEPQERLGWVRMSLALGAGSGVHPTHPEP